MRPRYLFPIAAVLAVFFAAQQRDRATAVIWLVFAIGAITVGYLIKRLEDALHKKDPTPDCLRRAVYDPDCPVIPVDEEETK